jgi:hypothetical protein
LRHWNFSPLARRWPGPCAQSFDRLSPSKVVHLFPQPQRSCSTCVYSVSTTLHILCLCIWIIPSTELCKNNCPVAHCTTLNYACLGSNFKYTTYWIKVSQTQQVQHKLQNLNTERMQLKSFKQYRQ